MKTLLIDLENGYKSIGSKETINDKFGLPLLSFNDFTSFRNFISQLWSRKKVERNVKVGGISVLQSSYEITEGKEKDSTKVDVGKWFDFVFYTKVSKAKDGTRQYLWVTSRDEHYCHAKDRTQELPSEIQQDYSIVFDAVNKKGWDTAKILVIGEPGSGKTLSLKTLVNMNKES
jgi:hypothetical protein